ncbi:MAG TPA: DUF2193 family protein [Anaerolineae bacterium]|nr:DUF2193 family protein [Anaerolineae bacterium]HMR64469.1 DUF2193 family protein [Anaerolineae bacterium]
MSSQKIYEAMVSQALAAVNADVQNIKAKRGTQFKLSDAKPYVDAVNGMKAVENEMPEVIALHVDSVNAHYEILLALTNDGAVRPEDDPFVEHYQTPPILEILYEEQPDFRKSVEKFIDAIAQNRALIGREVARIYGGMYGPTCVVDFTVSPGSTANVVNRILRNLDVPADHKKTILASKSFGMNTSYGLGAAFKAAVEGGKTLDEALDTEIATLQKLYDTPTAAQTELMLGHNLGGHGGHSSFDTAAYQSQYKDRMRPTIQAALAKGVHPANVVCIPAYCVGDVAHHNSQSMFNFAQDPIIMAIMEAHTKALENTMHRGLDQGFKNEYAPINLAVGTGAALMAYEFVLDYMPIPSVIELLVNRFHNMVAMNPNRDSAAELHNVDMIMSIHRGWNILKPKPLGKGGEIGGVKIDFGPIDSHEVLSNIHRYTYPPCAITQRVGAMFKLSDFPCLLTSEPVTATLMTHAVSLHPESPMAPLPIDKDWGVTEYRFINTGLGVKGAGADAKVGYEQWTEMV